MRGASSGHEPHRPSVEERNKRTREHNPSIIDRHQVTHSMRNTTSSNASVLKRRHNIQTIGKLSFKLPAMSLSPDIRPHSCHVGETW